MNVTLTFEWRGHWSPVSLSRGKQDTVDRKLTGWKLGTCWVSLSLLNFQMGCDGWCGRHMWLHSWTFLPWAVVRCCVTFPDVWWANVCSSTMGNRTMAQPPWAYSGEPESTAVTSRGTMTPRHCCTTEKPTLHGGNSWKLLPWTSLEDLFASQRASLTSHCCTWIALGKSHANLIIFFLSFYSLRMSYMRILIELIPMSLVSFVRSWDILLSES